MSKKLIITIVLVAVLTVIGLSWWGTYYSANSREISKRNLAEAEIEKVEIIHDQVFKTISQNAQVTMKYTESFEKIFIGIMEGRYDNGGGEMMKWIQESNPNFNDAMFRDLMDDIKVLREKFADQQIKVEDVIREHKTLCEDPWWSMFIKNKTPIEYEVISSAVTKKVIETREDNDIDLFK